MIETITVRRVRRGTVVASEILTRDVKMDFDGKLRALIYGRQRYVMNRSGVLTVDIAE